jgi:carboxyl-terminal processing protease
MRRSARLTLAGLGAALGVGWVGLRTLRPGEAGQASPAASCAAPASSALADEGRADGGKGDRLAGRALQLPSGLPVGLTCKETRRIVAQARFHLATEPEPVDPRALADATVDWLDPHGLWSASPDAPLASFLRRHERELLHDLEAPIDRGACRVADEAGVLIAAWVANLAVVFEDAERRAEPSSPADAFRLASEPAFEDRAVARPARDLARDLGHRVGVLDHTFGGPLAPFVRAARERFVPVLPASTWSQAMLAAALRAYLPQIDPHGGWAPLDEETSLYEVDLESVPPPRLWDRMVRTALGVRTESGVAPPVEARDLVLGVATIATAGLSVEQVEQLAIFDDSEPAVPRTVVILREGESTVRTLQVAPPADNDKSGDEGGVLSTEWVPFGEGHALVVEVADVPDDLGDLLAVTIARAKGTRAPTGIILDLRGNGGGSTDGANAALGLFLPGARLFPMKRRDGVIETERAPEPPETDRWSGPVAALVDSDTASAAEMIAGALASYRRGVVAGFRTYGKGCAQEYLDDETKSGVLRLTTLVYALPDGTPVQKIGLLPGLYLGPKVATEREATLSHALASWRGPDVRDRDRIAEVPWPGHHGHVGPCSDDAVCRTLRTLGAPRTAVARGRR